MASDLFDDEARDADLLARFGPEAVELRHAIRAHLLAKFSGRTLGVDVSVDEVRESLRQSGLIPELLPTEH